MQAFILAGGFATRLWPLTEKRAKPLLPLAGKPIISFLVEQIPAHIPITVSTNNAFAESFAAWAKEMERDNLSVIVEHTQSDDEKLGALGATAQWISDQKIDDDILLLTGDNYCGFARSDFLAKFTGTTLIAAHDIGSLEKATAFGTVITKEDGISVKEFEEKPKNPKSSLVNTGCSLIPRAHLPALLEHAKIAPDNVGGVFEAFLKQGIAINCYTFSEPWFDIGSFDAYLEATRSLVGEKLLIVPGVLIDETMTDGSVVIGTGSTVKQSKLCNVVIFENCTIIDCVLEDCILDNGCSLRGVDLTGKMLREGTVLRNPNFRDPNV